MCGKCEDTKMGSFRGEPGSKECYPGSKRHSDEAPQKALTQIDESIQELHGVINNLEHIIRAIDQKLTPILLPVSPTCDNEGKKEELSVPLAMTIREKNLQLRQLYKWLININDRIDL